MIVEHIARTALAKIIATPALWSHFANASALDAFWKLDPAARAALWGNTFDPMIGIAGVDFSGISDYELGKAELS